MTPTALAAIVALTGEPCHPCPTRARIYAVSRSWIVWHEGDDLHTVYRPTCAHLRNASLQSLFRPFGQPWVYYYAPEGLDLEALRAHVKACGYTVADVAARLGYVPTNRQLARYLAGRLTPSREFCQRAMAAFGRSVLRDA